MFKTTIFVGAIRQRINGLNVAPNLGALKSLGCVSLLSILAACGGSGSGSSQSVSVTPPPAADTQAPTITLSASKMNPEGGETVILSAEVTDNRDSGLTATLSCDGGNLRGKFLITSVTDTPENITCTATASDSSGNSTSEDIEIAIVETISQAVLYSGSLNAAQGQVVLIETKDISSGTNIFQGRLGSIDIEVRPTGDGLLAAIVPLDMEIGSTILSVDIEDSTYAFDISIEETKTVENAKQIVMDMLNSSDAAINQILQDPDINLTISERSDFEEEKVKVEEALAAIQPQSDDDLQATARYLIANQEGIQAAEKLVKSLPQFSGKIDFLCSDQAAAFADELARTIAVIGIAGTAVWASAALPGVNVIVASAALVTANTVYARWNSASGVPAKADIAYSCIFDNADAVFGFGSSFGSFKSTDYGLLHAPVLQSKAERSFFHDREERVALEETRILTGADEDSFFATLNSLKLFMTTNSFLPSSFSTILGNYPEEVSEVVSKPISLGSITPSTVSGSFSYPGNSGTIKLDYNGSSLDELDPGLPVNLQLLQAGEAAGSINVMLTAEPIAPDAMATITSTERTFIGVSVLASNLEITSQPVQGRVEASGTDGFIFTANEGADGEDEFRYVSKIGSKTSEEATVFLTIEGVGGDPLIGNWNARFRTNDLDQESCSPGAQFGPWINSSFGTLTNDEGTYELFLSAAAMDFNDFFYENTSRRFLDSDPGPGIKFNGSFEVSDPEFNRRSDVDLSVNSDELISGTIINTYVFVGDEGYPCVVTLEYQLRK